MTKIPYQESERQARQKKRVFQNWCLGHGYERAAELIDEKVALTIGARTQYAQFQGISSEGMDLTFYYTVRADDS